MKKLFCPKLTNWYSIFIHIFWLWNESGRTFSLFHLDEKLHFLTFPALHRREEVQRECDLNEVENKRFESWFSESGRFSKEMEKKQRVLSLNWRKNRTENILWICTIEVHFSFGNYFRYSKLRKPEFNTRIKNECIFAELASNEIL